jgi:hypothetical protein
MLVIRAGFTSLCFAAISQSHKYIRQISTWHVIVNRPLFKIVSINILQLGHIPNLVAHGKKIILIEIIECFHFVHCLLKSSNCLYMCLKSVGE